MKIPLLDIKKQNRSIQSKLLEAAREVIASGQYINGPAVQEFENNCKELLGIKHAIGVSSGTDALLVALMALDIKSGDEVICPSFTFFATAGAIARIGAIPVFIDIEEDTFNINPDLIEPLITEKTKAIIPVHLFGRTCNIEKIVSIAKKHNLFVIEDCAQSFNSKTSTGLKSGTLGDIGCFSFFPSKNLGGLGDAGLVICNDDNLAAKIKSLKNHGSEVRYYHDYIGANFRIDTLQAALLNVKLSSLSLEEFFRKRNAEYYVKHLSDLSGIKLPALTEQENVFNQFTILIKDDKRDLFQQKLTEEGIGSCIYYPVPLHKQKCFSYLKNIELPITDKVVNQCLSIPIGPELSLDDLKFIVNAISKIHYELFT